MSRNRRYYYILDLCVNGRPPEMGVFSGKRLSRGVIGAVAVTPKSSDETAAAAQDRPSPLFERGEAGVWGQASDAIGLGADLKNTPYSGRRFAV